MTQITDQLADIRGRIARAAEAAGRTADDITLLAVSKQQPAEALRAAWDAGQRHFAENYLQEALEKMRALSDLDIQWHFIGRIQSNKTRLIAERFDWVHTVDREKTAARLNAHRPEDLPPLKVFIQINQGDETQKAGISTQAAESLAQAVERLPRLQLEGLMSIPPKSLDTGVSYFRELARLRIELNERGLPVGHLSMGMSADYEEAIASGSDFVRLGTAIFGPRSAR